MHYQTNYRWYRYLILIIILAIVEIPKNLSAQQNFSATGGKAISMGGCSVAQNDPWSVCNNQAGLGFQNKSSFGIFSENRFGLKSLNHSTIMMVLPTKSGGLGFNISMAGYSKFNQKKLGFGYGKTFGKKLAFGVQLDYLHTMIGDNYGQKGNLTFEMGMMAKLTKDLTLGAHVFNPIKAALSKEYNQNIPSLFKLGINWKLSDQFVAAAEVENDIALKPIYKCGVEYRLNDKIFTRMGISNNPNLFSFGAGLILGNFILDFSSSIHSILGYSPQFSLVYIPNHNSKK